MQKETIRFLVNYNKSVNRMMNEIIKTLDQSEWEKSLGGFFPSVRSLCSHLYIGDFNWLKRFRALRTFTTLSDPFFDKELSFNETIFPDKNEYLEKRPELDDRFIAFAGEITDSDLTGILKFTDSHGVPHEAHFGYCALHSLTHEIHHRGMISLYLEMLGRKNDFSTLPQLM